MKRPDENESRPEMLWRYICYLEGRNDGGNAGKLFPWNPPFNPTWPDTPTKYGTSPFTCGTAVVDGQVSVFTASSKE